MSVEGVKVPFLDLRPAHAEIREELDEAIGRVIDRGWFILGEELEAFETEFAHYLGAAHCVGTGNGLDAIELSLRALGIGEGDEVIVPSNTYVATWLGVTRAGARVVPAEPLEPTFNLDPASAETAITRRTRAIIAVHLYGQPADMTALRAVADRHGVALVEDAAQAHGSAVGSSRVGALGDIAAWSFYPTKNLGALGDGGAITTNDERLAKRVAVLRNYGSSAKYVHDVPGVNSRLDELQAAILRVKLHHLDSWTERRHEVAQRYLEELTDARVVLPSVPPWATPVWHQFVIRTPARDQLATALGEDGIGTLVHYPIPPHLQGAYGHLMRGSASFPLAERLSREVLSLPIGSHIPQNQQAAVIQAIRDFDR